MNTSGHEVRREISTSLCKRDAMVLREGFASEGLLAVEALPSVEPYAGHPLLERAGTLCPALFGSLGLVGMAINLWILEALTFPRCPSAFIDFIAIRFSPPAHLFASCLADMFTMHVAPFFVRLFSGCLGLFRIVCSPLSIFGAGCLWVGESPLLLAFGCGHPMIIRYVGT